MLKNKITIIGAGMVGSTIAYSLLLKETVEEIAMIDINKKLLEAQIMDLQHSVSFAGQTQVHQGSYDDCQDSRLAIIACGIAQKPGQTRLDLLKTNAKIIQEVAKKIFQKNDDIVIIVVSNPVDILTRLIIEDFPDKKNQVFGSGTILDSARFRFLLGQKLNINPKSIHAYILGEHGDSEFPVWDTASIGNLELENCQYLSSEEKNNLFQKTKKAAYKIIEGKKSTYYAIGAGVAHLSKVVLFDRKTVLPVSHLMMGEYGIKNVSLSIPTVIGKRGIVKRICLKLSQEELNNLKRSADILEKAYQELKNQ